MSKPRLAQIAQDGATEGQVATFNATSGDWEPKTPTVKQLFSFNVNDATFPATTPAAATSRNEHPLIAFDDTTSEAIVLHGVISNDYSGGNVTVDLDTVADTATSGDFVVSVEVERIADGGTDIDADSFDTAVTATSTTNGTSGIVKRTSIVLSNAAADAWAAGDAFRLRVKRLPADAADDMTGDLQLLRVSGRQ